MSLVSYTIWSNSLLWLTVKMDDSAHFGEFHILYCIYTYHILHTPYCLLHITHGMAYCIHYMLCKLTIALTFVNFCLDDLHVQEILVCDIQETWLMCVTYMISARMICTSKRFCRRWCRFQRHTSRCMRGLTWLLREMLSGPRRCVCVCYVCVCVCVCVRACV